MIRTLDRSKYSFSRWCTIPWHHSPPSSSPAFVVSRATTCVAATRVVARVSICPVSPPSVRHKISYCTLFKAIIATRVHAIDPTRPGRETPQTRTRTPAPRPPRRAPRAAVMVSAVHGVLITADVPLKQYILHLNDLAPAEGKFLIADLDDRRVLVQPSRADAIRAEIERYQQSTQYVAPTTMTKQ